jgi:Heterokaryon incompatibility protein (HET)
LWIDALCIIQPESDGGKDWTAECTRMQDVYAGSTFTISATAGLNPNQGLFTWRPDQYIRIKPARLSEYKTVGSFCIARSPQDYQSKLSHFSNWTKHMDDLPISTRAWTLQERFLPPAVLHFYQGAACWECRTGLFEGEESTGILTDDELRSEVEAAKNRSDGGQAAAADRRTEQKEEPSEQVSADLRLLLPAHDTFKERYDFGWWYRIVELYQWRGVTRSEDRLPAIGGVAGHFAQRTLPAGTCPAGV